jgi:hypothetical protein
VVQIQVMRERVEQRMSAINGNFDRLGARRYMTPQNEITEWPLKHHSSRLGG